MSSELLAEIISTGSEMMLGRLVDTNSAWLSDILNGAGIKVARHTAVGDDLPRIVQAFQAGWRDHNIIVVTGGLGPTEDDLTREAAARAFGLELKFHENLAAELREHFARRGYTFTENNLRQVWLPRGALAIENPNGTAPGFALQDETHFMVFLPGVPLEMKPMTLNWFLPRLRESFPIEKALAKTVILKTAGLGESYLDSLIGDLISPDKNPEVGVLAAPDMVRVLATARGANEEELEAVLAPTLAELEKRLAGHVFGYGETTLPQAAAALLKEKKLALYITDAATQGRLAGLLGPDAAPENWAGAFTGAISADSPPASFPSPPKGDLIHLTAAARPDPEAAPPEEGQIALIIESRVQSEKINGGQALVRQFRVGGAQGRALARAASLSAFHLWQVLRDFC